MFAHSGGQPMGMVGRMYAASKYHNFELYEWIAGHARWGLKIICRAVGV